MALALVDLSRSATRRERFADTPYRPAAVLVDELAPERDDPSRVAAQLLERGKADGGRVVAHPPSERALMGRAPRHERGFARLERAAQKRHRAPEKVVG